MKGGVTNVEQESTSKKSFFQKKLPSILGGITIGVSIALIACMLIILAIIFSWFEIFNFFNNWAFGIVPNGFSKVIAFLLMAAVAAVPFSEVFKAFFSPLGKKALKRKIRVYTFLALAGIFFLYNTFNTAYSTAQSVWKWVDGIFVKDTVSQGKGLDEFLVKKTGRVLNQGGEKIFLFISSNNSFRNEVAVYVLPQKVDTTIDVLEGINYFILLDADGRAINYTDDWWGMDKWENAFVTVEFNGKKYQACCYYGITITQDKWLLQIKQSYLKFNKGKESS